MIRILTLSLLALLPAQDGPDLETLLRELEAEDVTRVYRALDRLVALGPDAAAGIESSAKLKSKTVQSYASLAVNELRALAVLGGRRETPKRISFDITDRKASKVLEEIAEAFDVRFEAKHAFQAGNPKISLQLKDATFVETLIRFCQLAAVMFYPNGEAYTIFPGAMSLVPSFFSEYCVGLMNTSIRRRIDFSGTVSHSMMLSFQLLAGKTKSAAHVDPFVTMTELRDDQGRSLLSPESIGVPSHLSNVLRKGGYLGSANLIVPSDKAKKLSRVRGHVRLRYAEKADAVLLGKPKETIEAGPLKVTLVSLEPELVVRVEAKDGRLDSIRDTILDFSIERERGRRTSGMEGGGEIQGDGSVLYRMKPAESHVMSMSVIGGMGVMEMDPPAPKLPRANPVVGVHLKVHSKLSVRRIPFEYRDVDIR